MELTTREQAIEVIRARKNILIALPASPSADAIVSGMALDAVLKGLGKKSHIASSDFQLPPTLGFLRLQPEIHPTIDVNRRLVVTLNLNAAKVGELSYNVEGDALKIFITPKSGAFEAKDVSTALDTYDFDGIITIDAPSLANLGRLFEENAEFFYHTPIINIDHHATNTSYGQVNLVDLVSTATAEIILDLVQQLKPDIIDDAIATNLLTGIITKTRCFRTPSVTPRALAAASQLIEAGAQREEIVRHLYQTRTLSALKLWGRALARLKEEYRGQFVWTQVGRQDFDKAGTDESELPGVVDELIGNTPRARVVAVLYEDKERRIRGIISGHRQVDALTIGKGLPLEGGEDYATVIFPATDLTGAEADILARVGQYLRNQGLID